MTRDSFLSEDLELSDAENTSHGVRSEQAALKRKRLRSRSRSITPPPALSVHQIQNARNLVRYLLGLLPSLK